MSPRRRATAADRIGRYRAQPFDDGAGIIEPTHMRVTRSETTIGARGTALTGRHGQHFRRLIETSTEEMGHAERQTRSGEIPAWAQPQRPLQMLDCGIVLAGMHAEKATEVPTAGAARIERNGTVDQGDGSVGVLTGHTKDRRGVGENAGIVVGDGQSLLRQSDRFAAASLRISRPAIRPKSKVAYEGPRKSRAVTRIARDRPFEQVPCLKQLFLRQPRVVCQSAQAEIVCGKVVSRRLAKPAR